MLVIDAESGDETVAIARAAGATVVVRPWSGFVSTRTFALGLVATSWTFMLDADETLDRDLSRALLTIEPPAGTDAYNVRRTTYFCKRPMRHGAWGGESLVRFFRNDRAKVVAAPVSGGRADLHERWVVAGEVGVLAGRLDHDSYPTVRSYREKFARYTTLEARGIAASPARVARAVVLAGARGLWHIFGRGAWRDGWRGIFVAIASACYPVAVAWKAWRA